MPYTTLAERLVRALIFLLSLVKVTLQKFSAALRYLTFNHNGSRERITLVWSPPRDLSQPIFETMDIQLTTSAPKDSLDLFNDELNQESKLITKTNSHTPIKSIDNLLDMDDECPKDCLSLAENISGKDTSHLEKYLDQIVTLHGEPEEDQDSLVWSEESNSSGDMELEFCHKLPPDFSFQQQEAALDYMSRGPVVAIINVDASQIYSKHSQQDVFVF